MRCLGCMRRCVVMAIAVSGRVAARRGSGRTSWSYDTRRVLAAGMVVGRCMSAREVGGRGSRTRPVRLEEPVLVPMTPAQRSAAVAALADIVATWWARQQPVGGPPARDGKEETH